ncbi:putative DNA-binding transcriptional regulator [Escherichia coli]|nr:putative DNA-binding transcriptional regulator [Escherichia coli]
MAKVVPLILVDTQVWQLIQNTPAFHNTPMLLEAEEPLAEYAPGPHSCLSANHQRTDNMTHSSRKKLRNFLSREGT